MENTILSIENLSKSFDDQIIIDNINLNINSNEIVALIGPSGAGKSTILNLITNVIAPDSGKIVVDNTNISEIKNNKLRAKKVGIIRQSFDLVDSISVINNVLIGRFNEWGFGKSFVNLFSTQEKDKALEVLRKVGIESKANQKVSLLSGGEKQRVAIARLMMQNPNLILADEPVSSLDPARSNEILELLISLAKEENKSLLASVHSVDLVRRHFDRAIALRDGKIIFDKNVGDISKDDFKSLYVIEKDMKGYEMRAKSTNNPFRLLFIFLLVFLFSLSYIDWSSGIIHAGGLPILKEIITAMINPDFSREILIKALNATWLTLSYALISISLAIILGLILGILASGVVFKNSIVMSISRGILGFLRAIHELVWAWIFVAAIGLNPIGAVIALAIPYAGALGKVYADLLMEVNKKPVMAAKLSGASNMQALFYVYFPEAFKEMLSYTLYRLECAVRSSSVLSFVGLGGLGFQIQLALQDMNFNRVWIYIYFLIALVLLISAWNNTLRKTSDGANKIKISAISLLVLIILSYVSLFRNDTTNLSELFSDKNKEYFAEFMNGLMGVGESTPAFMDGDKWINALKLSYETMILSIVAMGIATILMIIFVVFSARNVKNGTLISNNLFGKIMFYISRFLFLITRAIPELMWAMILVFIFKPGIPAGALALGLHNFGVLAKLCSEVIEEMDPRPIRNLSLNGASTPQALIYGIFPETSVKFINYILYRWEVTIRTTIVVGFVGAGGLGMAFKLAMSFFKYSEITLYMICYLILVYLADFISKKCKDYIR